MLAHVFSDLVSISRGMRSVLSAVRHKGRNEFSPATDEMGALMCEPSDSCCPACGCPTSSALEQVAPPEQHRLYARGDIAARMSLDAAASRCPATYQMLACDQCGLHYAEPLQNPGSQWYEVAYRVLSLYPQSRWEFACVLSSLDSSQRVADIGCGSGEFLRSCRVAEISATGFDFSRSAVKSCRERGFDAQILPDDDGGDLVGVADGDASVTCATAFHVLEHLSEPARLFRIVSTISRRIDRLFISVPSDRRPSRAYDEVDVLDQPPHHLTRWTPAALRELARSAGWSMTSLQYEPLPLVADLWHRAIRMPPYRFFAANRRARWAERSLRLLLYPSALFARMAGNFGMSGFSMLGRFDRV